jgi:hypothetical protein|tara:strand:- start:946 stop:2760 length:1815 start_codon:yes stop_codon:yes gene_type:complete
MLRLQKDGLIDMLHGRITEDPVEWIQSNINLSNDYSSDSEGFVRFAPYQLAPFKAVFEKETEEVIFMGPEQFGKSLIWKMAMLFSMFCTKEPKLIVYENDDKAEDINKKSFHPLVMLVDKFKRILENNPRAFKGRQYDLNGQVVSFQGSGVDITSATLATIAADEVDTWAQTYSKNKAQIENLRKRRRRYAIKNQGCLMICGSPKGTRKESVVWSRFAMAAHYYFHLRCAGCEELTIPSWNTQIIQYKLRDGVVSNPTIRCPQCKHVNREEDAVWMTGEGDYVLTGGGKFKSKRKAFQFGGLSNPGVLSWLELAIENDRHKDVRDYEMLRTRANSFDGVPLELEVNEDQHEALVQHCAPPPKQEDIKFTLLSLDTQSSPAGWYFVRRGYTKDLNSYLLKYGFVQTEDEVKALHEEVWGEVTRSFTIIDTGGHDRKKIYKLIGEMRKTGNAIGYRGAKQNKQFDWHKENQSVVMANAPYYDVLLLKKLYEDIDRGQNYLFLPEKEYGKAIGVGVQWRDYWKHMLAYVPNPRKGEEGESYENYIPFGGKRHDLFDCEKQCLLLLDLYGERLLREDSTDDVQKPVRKKTPYSTHTPNSSGWVNSWKA